VLNDILFDLSVVRAKVTFARNNDIFNRPFALSQNYVLNHIFFQHFGYAGSLMFLLNAFTFQNNPQLVNNPNVWIADSGATVHMSPYKIGMRNLRKATVEDAITMGNKRTEYRISSVLD
jgi:hypothetical protein